MEDKKTLYWDTMEFERKMILPSTPPCKEEESMIIKEPVVKENQLLSRLVQLIRGLF